MKNYSPLSKYNTLGKNNELAIADYNCSQTDDNRKHTEKLSFQFNKNLYEIIFIQDKFKIYREMPDFADLIFRDNEEDVFKIHISIIDMDLGTDTALMAYNLLKKVVNGINLF